MYPRPPIHSLVVLLLSSVAMAPLTGCSMIGLGAGYALESSQYEERAIRTSLPTGAAVSVTTTDGARHAGVYVGLTGLPSPQDSIAYEAARMAYEPPYGTGLDRLPAWGADAVAIQGTSDKRGAAPDTLRGQFVGFGLKRTERLHYVRIRHTGGSTSQVSLATTQRLRVGPITLGGNVLTQMVRTSRSFPSVTAMLIEQPDGATQRIPLYAVRVVDGPRRSGARWVGLGLGLTVDLILIAISSELSDWDYSSSQGRY